MFFYHVSLLLISKVLKFMTWYRIGTKTFLSVSLSLCVCVPEWMNELRKWSRSVWIWSAPLSLSLVHVCYLSFSPSPLFLSSCISVSLLVCHSPEGKQLLGVRLCSRNVSCSWKSRPTGDQCTAAIMALHSKSWVRLRGAVLQWVLSDHSWVLNSVI